MSRQVLWCHQSQAENLRRPLQQRVGFLRNHRATWLGPYNDVVEGSRINDSTSDDTSRGSMAAT